MICRGDTALHAASGCGDTAVAEALIKAGADVSKGNRYRDDSRRSLFDALYVYAENAIVHSLLCRHGRTPAHEAARAGHLSCVKLLVENGANVNSRDDMCDPPKYCSKCGHDFSLVFATFIIPCSCSQSCLHLSSEQGHLEVSRFLVESRADVNSQDNECDPP